MREKEETGGGDCAVDLSSSDESGEKKEEKPEDAELAAGSAPKKKPVATAEKDRRENMAMWAEMRKAEQVLASNGETKRTRRVDDMKVKAERAMWAMNRAGGEWRELMA